MAATKYRFRRKGVDTTYLAQNLPQGTVIDLTAALPKVFMDVQIDPSDPESEMDLVEAMDQKGWELAQVSPPTPLRGVTILQNWIDMLNVDLATNSDQWSDILSQDIETGDGVLNINGSISSTVVGGNVFFRIVVDGVQQAGLGHGEGLGGNAFNRRALTTTGPHNVKLQWRTDGVATATLAPLSQPDAHHATLMITEVVV